MSQGRFFTSNSVLPGHPDKLCDRISDALVDAHLAIDPNARIRAEVAAAGQLIFLVTDVEIRGDVDITGVVRRTIAETGYFPSDMDPDRCAILAQSSRMTPLGITASSPPETPLQGRSAGEAPSEDRPSTEQTTIFGYACSETPERMPLPVQVAHRIPRALGALTHQKSAHGLGPDGDV
jgi:S-adenosylmethionine synthetase